MNETRDLAFPDLDEEEPKMVDDLRVSLEGSPFVREVLDVQYVEGHLSFTVSFYGGTIPSGFANLHEAYLTNAFLHWEETTLLRRLFGKPYGPFLAGVYVKQPHGEEAGRDA